MRRPWVLIISLALNALLVVFWLTAQRRVIATRGRVIELPAAVTNPVRNRVVFRKQFFSWEELESADYRAYVNNLRDIGCPSQTIRDIIVADVNSLYARKRLAEIPSTTEEWWRADPDSNMVAQINLKSQALEQERRALLATLLGPNWETVDAPPHPPVDLSGPVLGELSDDAKKSVRAILQRSQDATEAYLAAQKAAGKNADPLDIAKLAKQMRADLAQVLNPAQMEEFLLRYSQSAAMLREQLRGVDVTPEEFRNLFQASDPLDQQLQTTTDPTQAANIQKQLDAAVKNLLGADRYQAYQLAQDPLYRDAAQQVAEAGAPIGAVQSLYQLNKVTAQEEQRIANDPTLTPQQAADKLKSVEAQAQAASDQLLGLAPPPSATTPAAPAAPPAPPASVAVHNYVPGETLDQIGAQYGVTAGAIMSANPNVNFNGLGRGTPINIPPRPTQQ